MATGAAPALEPKAETKTETTVEAGKAQPTTLKDRIVAAFIIFLPDAMNTWDGVSRLFDDPTNRDHCRSQTKLAKFSRPRKIINYFSYFTNVSPCGTNHRKT